MVKNNNKPFPALCMHCKWSEHPNNSIWSDVNACTNPKVVATYPWSLANGHEGKPNWPMCREERSKKSFFAPCGYKGKLWRLSTICRPSTEGKT